MEVRSPLTDSDHGKRPSPTMLNGMRVEKAGLDSQINTERVWELCVVSRRVRPNKTRGVFASDFPDCLRN